MKIRQFLLLITMVLSTMSFAQERMACSSCTDPGNQITGSNGNYSAATAQAYYWEVCEGNATISGSRTSKNVSVSCTGNYRLRLTRFQNGSCYTACEIISCGNTGGTCPSVNNLFYLNEGGGGLCTTGLAGMWGTSGVSSVNWTWALGGYSGTVNNAGTTTPIYHPVGDWSNYYMVICATATLNGGATCPKVCKSFLLSCGEGGFNYNIGAGATIYPNPTSNNFSVKNDGEIDITEIQVMDTSGKMVRSLKSDLDQEVDISNQGNGIYFVRLIFEDGTNKMEKLIIEK